jgi:hypothetical protein
MIRAIEHARRIAQPATETLIDHLPDLGESLHNAAIELARDCSLERTDMMLSRLQAATTSLVHLRKALAAEVLPDVVI